MFLDYHDSGMAGEPTNDAEHAFAGRSQLAAAQLAEVLLEEDAEVLTVYDERGGYEHPDHVMVHDVGVRAAALARTARVYAATVSRQHYERFLRELASEFDEGTDPVDDIGLGVDEKRITTTVDVRAELGVKRAMAARAESDRRDVVLPRLDDDRFADVFGTESTTSVSTPSRPRPRPGSSEPQPCRNDGRRYRSERSEDHGAAGAITGPRCRAAGVVVHPPTREVPPRLVTVGDQRETRRL